ncbi:PAS domain-containing hybrid sensor histidine kinase/response regulator [Histidinibacterium aquaticum]|uniref:histidine kinase n=1 Tax=Histidinibacterium aquaticum TaxID=2613962 RepID=A0A5J5GN67_9RHOB|nr:response regulator [Histidinibacterium aquaticum]
MVACGAIAGSLIASDPVQVVALRAAAGISALAGFGLMFVRARTSRRRRVLIGAATQLIENDPAVAFVTTGEGEIAARNAAAHERFGDPFTRSLGFVLTDIFANPGAVLFRLQSRAHAEGHALEEIMTRRATVRLAVQRLDREIFLWRLEEESERGGTAQSLETLGLPMLTAGPSGTILYMNAAFRELTGGRVKSLNAVFTDLPLVSGRIHEVRGQDGPMHRLVGEVTTKGGRREIYLLPGDGIKRVEAPGWDAIEDLPVPLLRLSSEGEVLEANRQARQLLKLGPASPRRLGEIFDGLGRPVGQWLREASEGQGRVAPEFLRVIGCNEDTFVQVALNRVGEDAGHEPHLIAVLRDVTDFKSLEAQFVQSQKMQAIGQLAGGVAHDFNNLLTAISGHCDLLLLRHDESDPDYGDLVQIHQNANRAASLVGQLLAFSRKQTLRLSALDLRDTLSDLTHLLNRLVGERITLTLSHDPNLRCIRADKRQLEQVMMNLVVNARDAMPTGGEIRIETESLHLSEPLRRDRTTVPEGDWVAVRVIDEGRGMSEEALAKIFEPFFTTKRLGEGTGLGLSTAYGIVKQTGGYIFADSAPDLGTTFTLYFPARDEEPAATLGHRPDGQMPALPAPEDEVTEGVVLLVEDEAPVRAFASRALRLRGFTVLEADSAEAALDLLENPDLRIDIFVTDVIMPGKDGPTWVREALQDRPQTRVVFVSGYAEDAVAENQSQVANSVFLPKPFSLTDLTRAVTDQLSAGRVEISREAPPDARQSP